MGIEAIEPRKNFSHYARDVLPYMRARKEEKEGVGERERERENEREEGEERRERGSKEREEHGRRRRQKNFSSIRVSSDSPIAHGFQISIFVRGFSYIIFNLYIFYLL